MNDSCEANCFYFAAGPFVCRCSTVSRIQIIYCTGVFNRNWCLKGKVWPWRQKALFGQLAASFQRNSKWLTAGCGSRSEGRTDRRGQTFAAQKKEKRGNKKAVKWKPWLPHSSHHLSSSLLSSRCQPGESPWIIHFEKMKSSWVLNQSEDEAGADHVLCIQYVCVTRRCRTWHFALAVF